MPSRDPDVERVLRAMRVLRDVTGHAEMTVNSAVCYLAIATWEDDNQRPSVSDIADYLEWDAQLVSRAIGPLLEMHRVNRKGLGLVVSKATEADRRKRTLSLTAKGRRVLSAVYEAISAVETPGRGRS